MQCRWKAVLCFIAVQWLRRLVAGLSQLKPWFDLRSVHVRFVVDSLPLGQVFREVLRVSPVCNIPLLPHTNLPLHIVLTRGLGIKKHQRFFGNRGVLDGRELSLLLKSVFFLLSVSRDEVLMASPVHCRTPCRCLIVVSSLPSRSVLLQVTYRCEFLEQTVYCVFSFPVGLTCSSRRAKSLWCRCSFDLLQLVLVNYHSISSSSS